MKSSSAKCLWTIAGSALIMTVSVMASLSAGEVHISLFDIPALLSDHSTIEYGIITHIRIPRTILALAVGGSLSLSGVILQGIFHNPLVEPYTLGISGGASVGVTLALVTGLSAMNSLALPLSGFAGAFATIFIIYALNRHGTININRMLLTGVMISFISSSLVMLLMSLTTVEHIHGIIFWTMGSLSESDTFIVNGLWILSLVILGISYIFAIPLNAMRVGELKAKHLGINTPLIIRILFVLTSLLTGCCIAVAGVIGFVGLIIPHITRFLVGSDYKALLVSSFLNGGIFLIWCDILSRTIMSPNELPIGVITGIMGGISFIFIISSSKRKPNMI